MSDLAATSSDIPASDEACATIPPVQSSYKPLGEMIQMAPYDNVYAIGDPTSGVVVICLFDVFGFAAQTRQGADIIAKALNARVLMPDVFFGQVLPPEYPFKDNDEENNKWRAWISAQIGWDQQWDKLSDFVKRLRQDPHVSKVYLYGLCWGGKVATLAGCETIEVNGAQIPAFDAVASLHPGRLSASDATNLLVPLALFPSRSEPLEEYKKTVEILDTKAFAALNSFRYYGTMNHGWAGARADLSNPENLAEFGDVYGRLAAFFSRAGGDVIG